MARTYINPRYRDEMVSLIGNATEDWSHPSVDAEYVHRHNGKEFDIRTYARQQARKKGLYPIPIIDGYLSKVIAFDPVRKRVAVKVVGAKLPRSGEPMTGFTHIAFEVVGIERVDDEYWRNLWKGDLPPTCE